MRDDRLERIRKAVEDYCHLKMGVEVWQGLEEKVKNILEEPTPEGEVEIVTRYEKCGCVTTFLAKDIDEKDRKSLREIKCSEHKAPTPKECESEERFLATLPPEKQGYCSDSPYCDHGSCEELRQSAKKHGDFKEPTEEKVNIYEHYKNEMIQAWRDGPKPTEEKDCHHYGARPVEADKCVDCGHVWEVTRNAKPPKEPE